MDIIKSVITEMKRDLEEASGAETSFRADFVNELLSEEELQELIKQDALFSLFSVAFVYCYLVFHLESIFLSTVGILLIIFSFPVTLIIVKGLLGVSYIGSLQIISIYIILGIGADDIFIFVDAWNQTIHLAPEVFNGDKKRRMAYTFRRAVRSMAVTSSTTAITFMANIVSPVMPIKSFGVISGVLIPVNYFLVVIFMPPAVIYYDKKFAHQKFCSSA